VTIQGTEAVLPSDTLDLFPGKIRLIIHPPIAISGFSDDNIRTLMDRTRRAIDSGFSMNEDA
jgi:1-acyl-sn-glycerol-3-phosphate acyltransferase